MQEKILKEINLIKGQLIVKNTNTIPPFTFGELGGQTLFFLYSGKILSSTSDFNTGISLLETLIPAGASVTLVPIETK